MLRQGSFVIPCRERLRLLVPRRSGSAFPAEAVAQRGLEGFVEKVPLICAALPPLPAHRIVQAAPWLSNSALHPMVWATMASADFSSCVGGRLRPPAPVARRQEEISQGKTLILPPSAAGYTAVVSVWLLEFPVRSRVVPPHRPCIRFLFVGSEVCRRLPPHPHRCAAVAIG